MSMSIKIFLVFSILVNTACASEKCVFSTDLFSENTYKNNSSISMYEWSDESKEVKGILKNGNMFSIKHWSCSHYGTQAVLFIGPNLVDIPDILNENVLMLADISLSKVELKLLSAAINDKDLLLVNSPQKIVIPNHDYSEFYISYSVIDEVIIIEIKLYRD